MPRVLNFVVALAGLSAAIAARLVYDPEKQALAGGLLGLSVLLLGGALRTLPVPLPLDPEGEELPVPLPRRRLLLGIFLALGCVVFTALSVRAFGIEAQWRSAWPLHGAAMACLVAAGFALTQAPGRALPALGARPPRASESSSSRRCCASSALGLPPGCWFDRPQRARGLGS
jgi:hypothetical protein